MSINISMARPTDTAAAKTPPAAETAPLSDEVLQLIDHIAEILAEEFAAAMQPKKEADDARSSLR